MRTLLQLKHLIFGHPVELCKYESTLCKRCICGEIICLSDFY